MLWKINANTEHARRPHALHTNTYDIIKSLFLLLEKWPNVIYLEDDSRAWVSVFILE